MADMKIPPNLPSPVRSPRAETIRAAQKAFFNAALNEVQAQASRPEARPAPKAGEAPAAQATAEPQRYLRPGSRVDIKV